MNPRLPTILVFCLIVLVSSQVLHAKTTFQGVSHYSLNEIARMFKMKLTWEKQGDEALVYNSKTRLIFTKKKRYFSLNGRRVWLGNAIRLHKNRLFISELDYKGTIAPILTPTKLPITPGLKHVVIDPGHGGKDHGTSNKVLSVTEKAMALDVSIRLKRILLANGYKVSLTRSNDTFVPLKKRPEISNKLNADLFVSVHFNSVAARPSSVHGIETYALTPINQVSTASHKLTALDRKRYPGNKSDPWNTLAGFYIHNMLVKDLKVNDRGLKRARFAVLKGLKCPGLLIEAGFVSHPQECKRIKSAQYRQQIAQSIANGIIHYHKALNHIHSSA